ncbi:MAG: ribbon-helix-helix domain-containing protein [Polyangiales bacterium]
MTITTIALHDDQLAQLARLSKAERLSRSSLVRAALQMALDSPEATATCVRNAAATWGERTKST